MREINLDLVECGDEMAKNVRNLQGNMKIRNRSHIEWVCPWHMMLIGFTS
jgi:hypothetical protein